LNFNLCPYNWERNVQRYKPPGAAGAGPAGGKKTFAVPLGDVVGAIHFGDISSSRLLFIS
jgi:hypothetical protein